ncbi:MAG: RidA family protein [Rhodospirillaceae bacterium]|nr:RidA family protein [Rhodospirillaceae bacterium]
MAIEHHDIGERISRAVVHNGTIYLAGQASAEPAGDAQGQTTAVLKKVDELLTRCGSSKDKVLFALIHLADLKHFDAMNKAWVAWAPQMRPARTVVEAKLPKPEFLVEITVTAAQK